jgi:hypothetical protein
MTHQQGCCARLFRLGKRGVLALLLAACSGCLSFVHPITPPSAELLAPSAAVPAECRRHVYIFLVHGMDPLDLANLSGMQKWINSLGYSQVYYGQLYHLWEFEHTLVRIHKEDPAARFVLLGFSFGANMVRTIANVAGKNNITIDLLVYTGGNTLENTVKDQPPNVLHIANILASGCIWNGSRMDRADNINYDDVWHFGSPSHKRTRDYVSRELAVVAQRVPPATPPVIVAPPVQENSTLVPQPATSAKVDLPPEWSFLQPRAPADEPRGMTGVPASRLRPVAAPPTQGQATYTSRGVGR